MKITRLLVLTVLAGLTLLVTACSNQAAPTIAPSTLAPPAEAPASTPTSVAGTTVMVGKNVSLGSILVDDKDMTLYLYTKDTPNTSSCYGPCATNWPPLLTTGNAVAGDGVDSSKLGTTLRTDGTTQVTYNGWPLYYYFKDKAPGDIVGQNVGGVWHVLSAAGIQITTAP